MSCSFDIFFLEAVLNGLLLAGLLALLSLGLNLIFGVIDVVWICYAEVVMVGMYAVYYFHATLGIDLIASFAAGIAVTMLLDSAPINQLLATGGVLVLLQSGATLLFGIEYRNLGVQLGSTGFLDMYFAWSRIITLGVALSAMLGLMLFLRKTYIGHGDPCAQPGPDRHAADGRGQRARLFGHIGHRRRAGGAGGGADDAAIRHLSPYRPAIRAAGVHGLRLGRLGQPDRRLYRRAGHLAIHCSGRLVLCVGMGLRHRFSVLHRNDVHPARRPAGEPLKCART
jgi:hypothetical protein